MLLLLSASAGLRPRPHHRAEKKISPLEPPTLCMLLRKHIIRRPRRATLRQINGDRILEIDI